jgi:hypothetical protein
VYVYCCSRRYSDGRQTFDVMAQEVGKKKVYKTVKTHDQSKNDGMWIPE